MPNELNVSAGHLAQLQDFRNFGFKSEDIIKLAEREGKFTLDDQGKLTVINPPAGRDGTVVRFFKGIFSSSYRAEQRILDRMESLDRNAAFSKELFNKARYFYNSGEIHGRSQIDRWGTVFGAGVERLRDQTITPANLKIAVEAAWAEVEANRIPEAIKMALDSGAGIMFTPAATLDFRSFFRDGSSFDLKQISLPNIVRNLEGQIIRGENISVNGESLLSAQAQGRLRELVAAPPRELSLAQNDELASLRAKLVRNLANAVAHYTNQAMRDGAHPGTAASNSLNLLRTLEANHALEEAFIPKYKPEPENARPFVLSDTTPFYLNNHEGGQHPKYADTKLVQRALSFFRGDQFKAAELVANCLMQGVKVKHLESAISVGGEIFDVARNSTVRNIIDDPMQVFRNLNSIKRETTALGAEQMTGADDMMSVYDTALLLTSMRGDDIGEKCLPVDEMARITAAIRHIDIQGEGAARTLADVMSAAFARAHLVPAIVGSSSNAELESALTAIDAQGVRHHEINLRLDSAETGRLFREQNVQPTTMHSRVLGFLCGEALRAQPEGNLEADRRVIDATIAANIFNVTHPEEAKERIAQNLIGQFAFQPNLLEILNNLRDMRNACMSDTLAFQIERGRSVGADDANMMTNIFANAMRHADTELMSRVSVNVSRNHDLQSIIRSTGASLVMSAASPEEYGIKTNGSTLEALDIRNILAALHTGMEGFLAGVEKGLGLPEVIVEEKPGAVEAGKPENAQEHQKTTTRILSAMEAAGNLPASGVSESVRNALTDFLGSYNITCEDVRRII